MAIAALIAIGLAGACTAAGMAWLVCWLLGAPPMIMMLTAQCAGLLGAVLAAGLWMLFRINAAPADSY